MQSSRAPNVQTNPVYQSIKIALNQADLEVVTLKERLRRKQAEARKLGETTEALPEIEAEMKRLNRDYAITKSQYEALLQRREVAKLSEEVEQGTDEVKFRIIEPPRAELNPSEPNRPLLLSATMAGGLAMAIGLCFFLSQIRPVYTTLHALRDAVDYPVLGSISAVRTSHQIRKGRAEIASFTAAGCALLLAYGLVVLFRTSAHEFTQMIAGGLQL